jgi:hypothetical protein
LLPRHASSHPLLAPLLPQPPLLSDSSPAFLFMPISPCSNVFYCFSNQCDLPPTIFQAKLMLSNPSSSLKRNWALGRLLGLDWGLDWGIGASRRPLQIVHSVDDSMVSVAGVVASFYVGLGVADARDVEIRPDGTS